jgi:hypothetical protein
VKARSRTLRCSLAFLDENCLDDDSKAFGQIIELADVIGVEGLLASAAMSSSNLRGVGLPPDDPEGAGAPRRRLPILQQDVADSATGGTIGGRRRVRAKLGPEAPLNR